ncbi:hypothetical protein [Sphingobacterium multivorum]|uniref:hypothetical protein n=1 Tax=Sphingobacterium multivorum TaxID=28454 RepID=UPI00345EE611
MTFYLSPMLYNPFEQVTKSSFRELVESGYADFVLQRFEWPDVTEKTGFLLTPYDDKVCYVYNVAPTPSEPEWHKKENLPFLNPADFVKENLEPFDAWDVRRYPLLLLCTETL